MMNTFAIQKEYRRVADFYVGKSVLITGASGFVGAIILETLLRCCPGIHFVFIVLRGKKGKSPEERKDEILEKTIFNSLRTDNPEVFKKVRLIVGDVSDPYLGMTEADLEIISEEVSIVFHCAASISFLKPLRYLLNNNFVGTQNVIEVCRRLKKLEILLYTSTGYSNCNRCCTIQERVYRLPFPAQMFLDALKKEDDAELESLYKQCKPEWPNFYTFSKCLSENLMQDNGSDFRTCIIRPTLVASTWKGPLPGYAEDNSTLAQLCIGIAKGFIKVMYADPNVRMDCIPADVVANAHIVAAWSIVTGRSPSQLIVNCTSYGKFYCTLKEFQACLMGMCRQFPMPKTFRSNGGSTIVKSFLLYKMLTAYEHYLPGTGIDLLLRLRGRKPVLVPLYMFYDKASTTANFFLSNNWDYETRNLQTLHDHLDSEDRKIFSTDLTGMDIKTMAYDLPSGFPPYDWSCDAKPAKKRMQIAKQRYVLTQAIKYVAVACTCLSLYLIIWNVL